MPSKYECKACARTFVHKETFEEHKLLHGCIIQDSNRFSCPICLHEVFCHLGSHNHVHNNRIEARRSKCLENLSILSTGKDKQSLLSNLTAHQDHAKKHFETSDPEICSNKRRSRRSKAGSSEECGVNAVNASVNLECEMCRKTFIYLKCLLKHQSTVHGICQDETKLNVNQIVGHEEEATIMTPDVIGVDVQENRCSSGQNDANQSNHLVDATSSNVKTEVSSDDENNDVVGNDDGSGANDCLKLIVEAKSESTVGVGGTQNGLLFTCKTCLKIFKYKTTLVRHWRVVHGGLKCDKCTCPICSQIFDNQLTFSKHFDGAHHKKAVEILSTLKHSMSVGGEVISSTIESGMGVVRCIPCKQWFTCRRSLLKHSGLKHRVITCSLTGKILYKCVHCGEMFDTDRQLVYHRHNIHYINKTHGETTQQSLPLSKEQQSHVDTNKSVGLDSIDTSDDDTIQGSDTDTKTVNRHKKAPKHFCNECSKAFASVAFLIRHRKMKHGSRSMGSNYEKSDSSGKRLKQLFVCGQCCEEFELEDALAQHVEFIHKGISNDNHLCICPLCCCDFPSQAAFSQHYEATHHEKQPRPPSSSTLGLSSTATVQDEAPVVQCKLCQQWLTDQQSLVVHRCQKRATVRSLTKSRRARYRCIECGEAFEILRRFLDHRRVKHCVTGPEVKPADDQLMQCSLSRPAELPLDVSKDVSLADNLQTNIPQCSRGRPPKELVPDSEMIKSVEPTESAQRRPRLPRGFAHGLGTDGANLQCPECNRVFATIALLRKHRKSEHRNRTCQLCGEICKSADMVYYHNLKHHHEQKCDMCGASCSGRLGLIEHYRAAHPNEQAPLINRKTLICEYCPRVFASCASRLLRDHIESCHLGRVHLCDVCGKRLGSAQTLAVHRRMHDPVARFACVECNRRFPHNTNLVNHIRKHHPDQLPAKYVREFRCEICSMQFGSSSGLTRHRSEKHSSMRYQCDQCLRVFQSAASIRVHRRRDHPQKDVEQHPPPAIPQPSGSLPLGSGADTSLMGGIESSLPSMEQTFQT